MLVSFVGASQPVPGLQVHSTHTHTRTYAHTRTRTTPPTNQYPASRCTPEHITHKFIHTQSARTQTNAQASSVHTPMHEYNHARARARMHTPTHMPTRTPTRTPMRTPTHANARQRARRGWGNGSGRSRCRWAPCGNSCRGTRAEVQRARSGV